MANGMKWSLAGLLGLDISVPQLKPNLMDSMRVLGRKGKKCDVLAVRLGIIDIIPSNVGH